MMTPDVKSFQCPICGRTFTHKSNVKKHVTTHKVWVSGLTKTLPENGAPSGYECPHCSCILDSHPKLRSHLKEHSDLKIFACIQPQCTASFADVTSLTSHVSDEHQVLAYHCTLCSFVGVSLPSIGAHYAQHTTRLSTSTSSKYTCQTCKSRFASATHLQHHLNTASHDHSCATCSKSFTCERSLRRHLATHSSRSFQCHLCPKRFCTEAYLRAHTLVHSAARPFTCTVCSLAFARKDRLTRHAQIHVARKRFKCPLRDVLGCSKEYDRTDKLHMHLRTHAKVPSIATTPSSTLPKRTPKSIAKMKPHANFKTIEIVVIKLDKRKPVK